MIARENLHVECVSMACGMYCSTGWGYMVDKLPSSF